MRFCSFVQITIINKNYYFYQYKYNIITYLSNISSLSFFFFHSLFTRLSNKDLSKAIFEYCRDKMKIYIYVVFF